MSSPAQLAAHRAVARESAERAMVLEMSAGAEATGASFAEYKRLETEFSLSLGVLYAAQQYHWSQVRNLQWRRSLHGELSIRMNRQVRAAGEGQGQRR